MGLVFALLFGLFAALAAAEDACFANYIVGKPVNILFHECDPPKGGKPYPMQVDEIKLGNSLFNTKNQVSLFFVGEPIQICLKGRFREDVSNLNNLASSVHGDVQIIGDLVKIKYPFCDIETQACNGFSKPGCGNSAKRGDEFCFCSLLKEVPTSPDVNADVYWKIVGGQINPNTCEKEFDVDKLIGAGKTPLSCIWIPATVKITPPSIFTSVKSQILAKFGIAG